jgi:integrase/recombinase XerD
MKTLKELSEEYLGHLRSLNYSERTLEAIEENVGRFLAHLGELGAFTADLVHKSHLLAWQKRIFEHRTAQGLPLKAVTMNRRIIDSKGFLKYLAKRGFVLPSLLDALSYVRKPNPLPGSVLSHHQAKRLLAKIDTSGPKGHRDRTIMELMYSSGLRADKVVRADVRSVDFKLGTVTVMGKGRKERIVPVGKTALRFLETYVKAVRPFMAKKPGEDALFLNHYGRRLHYRTLLEIVHLHRGKLDVEFSVTPHTFRRSCATELIRGGANVYHVKDMLGHESLETLRYYTRLTITDLRKTHEKCHPRERDG